MSGKVTLLTANAIVIAILLALFLAVQHYGMEFGAGFATAAFLFQFIYWLKHGKEIDDD
jgi:hypothetical protein